MIDLTQWVFICDRNGIWKCAKRENYRELHNYHNSDKVMRASSVDVLIDLIQRTDGDPKKLEELVKS